jgi:hypothetical protein
MKKRDVTLVSLSGAIRNGDAGRCPGAFADELSDSIETAQQQAMAGALEIYYAAEKLAKDPEHAHLMPHVEQMRTVSYATSGRRFRRSDRFCPRVSPFINRERRAEAAY